MQLTNLKPLHTSMVSKGFTRVQFKATVSNKQITVLFIAEGSPYLLGILVDGHMFSMPIQIGFQLNPILPYQDYTKLSKLMQGDSGRNETFHSGSFFKQLDEAIPKEISTGMFIPPGLALLLYPNVDEAEKHHFMGFQKISNQGPTEHNLEKTKLLIGEESYKLCKAQGLSSRWSEDASRAIKVVPEIAKLKQLSHTGQKPPTPKQTTNTPVLTEFHKLGVLCGAPGTGKSTLSRDLQRLCPHLVVLDLDVVTAPLVNQMLIHAKVSLEELALHKELQKSIEEAQYSALISLAHDLLSQGHYPLCVASFENNLANPELFVNFSNDLKLSGVQLKLAVLKTSQEEAKRRISQRADPWDAIRIKHWGSLKYVYEHPAIPYSLNALVENTTNYSRQQLVSKLASFFAK